MNSAEPYAVPLLKIEGPPGSGKTRELAREACRLMVQDGYPASKVLLLEATPLGCKRLLNELKVEAELGGITGRLPAVQTLDRWIFGVLQTQRQPETQALTLLKDAEAEVLVQEVLRQVIPMGHPLHYATRQGSARRFVWGLLRQLQLQGYTPSDVQEKAKLAANSGNGSRLSLLAEIYRLFQERLQAGNLVCHAQLGHRVLEWLTHSSAVLEAVRKQISVILVDDAQELSEEMYRIFALLGCRLVLAGNEKLSIRGFRGAEPEQFVTLATYQQSQTLMPKSVPVTFLPKQTCWRGNDAILSLLNGFLPQPIWESQGLDTAQLKQAVQFGYFNDPQQEAERLAAYIQSFVKTTRILPKAGDDSSMSPDGRAARWSDCVLLLRSSHYKPHLLQAFQQMGIPYQWEMLSQETIWLQHGIYDLFKVLTEWQAIGLQSEDLKEPERLQRGWANYFNYAQEQDSWTVENNRHLMRCLETLFLNENQIAELRHLSGLKPGETDSNHWLPLILLNPDLVPPALAFVAEHLNGLYQRLYAPDSALECLNALEEILSGADIVSPDLDEADSLSRLAALQIFKTNLLSLDSRYQAGFGKPLSLQVALENFSLLWDGADSTESAGENKPETLPDQVRILGLHQVQGEEYPLVIIPFLVNGEFPYIRQLPELLAPDEQMALGFSDGYRIEEAEEARLLAVGLSRATHQVILSSHAQDGSERILPSDFYATLLKRKRQLLGSPILHSICGCIAEQARDSERCSVDLCCASSGVGLESESTVACSPLLDRYTGSSVWANLARQTPEPLFSPQETLNLSASSIKTYMQCPRQFYYKHLLKLPQPTSDVAALGTLVHRVMEVFNRQAGQLPYTAQSLKSLAERLFLFDADEEAFYSVGFEDRDKQNLSRLSPLGLSQLKQRLLASIEDLVEKGYFDRYGSLRRVYPEKTLEGVTLPGLERARFRGAMDAVIELSDGSVEIVDYKTFRSAYGAGLDTCDKRFLEVLEPLPDDEDLTHAERFASKMSGVYPTDYQLPLYYLACRQDPAIGDKLRAVALQIIRPAFSENPYQGAIRLAIPAEQIEAKKQQIIQDINRYIVSPILDSATFEPNPSPSGCANCAYFSICEAGDDADLQEDGAE